MSEQVVWSRNGGMRTFLAIIGISLTVLGVYVAVEKALAVHSEQINKLATEVNDHRMSRGHGDSMERIVRIEANYENIEKTLQKVEDKLDAINRKLDLR